MPIVVDPGYSDIYSDVYGPTTTDAAILYVEAEFTAGVWTDLAVGHNVRQVSTRRGRTSEFDSFSAGTAGVTLDNRDRAFDPTYTSSPYYPNVKPNRRLRVSIHWAGTLYHLFTGYVDGWPQEYTNPADGWVSVSATDGFKLLANASNPNPVMQLGDADVGYLGKSVLGTLSDELTGVRIRTTIEDVGWSDGYQLDAGRTTLPGAQAKGTALDHLQSVASTEEGRMFISGDGTLVFLDRYAPFLNTRSKTSQATFGDGAGELQYHDITFDYSDAHIRNDVSIRIADAAGGAGAEITVEDEDSVEAYFRHSFDKEVLYTNPTTAENHAGSILTRYKDPLLRVESITIKPWRDPTNLIPQVLGREIGDRITIKRRPQDLGSAISTESHIESVSHSFEPNSGTWTVTWTLSPADIRNAFVLGTSQLGSGVLTY